MMAANYQHIGGHENRLGRHYSRFSAFWSPAALTDQSLALRKSQNAGSNGRSRARKRWADRCSFRFAADSSLEGDGFEPSVPARKSRFLSPKANCGTERGSQKGCFVCGTEGSNPSPSSGESLANLTSGDGAARSGKNSGWGQRPHAATRVPEFNDIVRLSRQVLDGPQGRAPVAAAGCAAQRTD
jgi:hypothetical protein